MSPSKAKRCSIHHPDMIVIQWWYIDCSLTCSLSALPLCSRLIMYFYLLSSTEAKLGEARLVCPVIVQLINCCSVFFSVSSGSCPFPAPLFSGWVSVADGRRTASVSTWRPEMPPGVELTTGLGEDSVEPVQERNFVGVLCLSLSLSLCILSLPTYSNREDYFKDEGG